MALALALLSSLHQHLWSSRGRAVGWLDRRSPRREKGCWPRMRSVARFCAGIQIYKCAGPVVGVVRTDRGSLGSHIHPKNTHTTAERRIPHSQGLLRRRRVQARGPRAGNGPGAAAGGFARAGACVGLGVVDLSGVIEGGDRICRIGLSTQGTAVRSRDPSNLPNAKPNSMHARAMWGA